MQQGVEDPDPENLHIEEFRFLGRLVEQWIPQHSIRRAELLEETHGKWGHGREEDIVQANGPALEEDLARPTGIDGEPELNDIQAHVLVEAVQDQLGDPGIIPGSVYQQQPLQIPELGYRVIRGTCRLETLYAGDSDAHTGLLDHGHIIRPVTNGQGNSFCVEGHHLNHLGLLHGRDPAADNHAAEQAEFLEIIAQIAAQGILQGGAVNHQCHVGVLGHGALELAIVPLDDIASGLKEINH